MACLLPPFPWPVQTSNFTCAVSNANEQNLLFLLISIRFGTCSTFEPGLSPHSARLTFVRSVDRRSRDGRPLDYQGLLAV